MSFREEVRDAVRYERFLVAKALATLALVGLIIVLHVLVASRP